MIRSPSLSAKSAKKWDKSTLNLWFAPWRPALIVAFCIVISCLLGIFTRPIGLLAALWPANAVLLTLLIRLRGAASPLGIFAAAAAYVCVDLYIGTSLLGTVLLNFGNLVSVLVSYAVWSALLKKKRILEAQNASLVGILATGLGASTAGFVGGIANPILFNGGQWDGWYYWFATEFINYMIFLPVLVSVPVTAKEFDRSFDILKQRSSIWPALAVAVSAAASILVGGPGAIAFPIPALLWVALSYTVFPTSLLVMLFSIWFMFSITNGGFLHIGPTDQSSLASIRLGISLIALFPVVLSQIMQKYNEVLSQLNYQATHDSLTSTLSVAEFRKIAQKQLNSGNEAYALLMVDIDHFKTINDTYGHDVGDKALQAFSDNVRLNLRPNDIFGRIGGEEFAIMLKCSEAQALPVAERIRETVKTPVRLDTGQSRSFSVSIGLATIQPGQLIQIDRLLKQADLLLYQAKRRGRDRTETVLEETNLS
ncbi:sensor domain-containing diguanylate cyclase [Cohaesibacter haloalkalitolerans]|uniref:sensor domain-containing diguanylate cyclase n=1 Tax=Cohaesibacter haloalkalitolerans TaxID=1162980 RepID=UPI000E64676A|nr:GGDEF domain-containing protein [Cohaesibacter haloalkalitolerans]